MTTKELITTVVEFQTIRKELITNLVTKNKFLKLRKKEILNSDTTDSTISKHSNRLPKSELRKYNSIKEVILDNLAPLVYKLASYYSRKFNQVDIKDLIQEGHIAVIKAMVKFDCNQSNSFTNYAKIYIKSYQTDYINRNFSLTKVKYHLMREVIRDYKNNEIDSSKWNDFAILQQYKTSRSQNYINSDMTDAMSETQQSERNTSEDMFFGSSNKTIAKEAMTLESLLDRIECSLSKHSMEILKLKLKNPEIFSMLNIDDREETKAMKKELKELLMLLKEQGVI